MDAILWPFSFPLIIFNQQGISLCMFKGLESVILTSVAFLKLNLYFFSFKKMVLWFECEMSPAVYVFWHLVPGWSCCFGGWGLTGKVGHWGGEPWGWHKPPVSNHTFCFPKSLEQAPIMSHCGHGGGHSILPTYHSHRDGVVNHEPK